MPTKPESDKSKSDVAKAAKWRGRAKECRVELEEMTNDSARRSMALIAKFYDQLAKRVEVQADELSASEKPRRATSIKR
jgi:hypothetical protein